MLVEEKVAVVAGPVAVGPVAGVSVGETGTGPPGGVVEGLGLVVGVGAGVGLVPGIWPTTAAARKSSALQPSTPVA